MFNDLRYELSYIFYIIFLIRHVIKIHPGCFITETLCIHNTTDKALGLFIASVPNPIHPDLHENQMFIVLVLSRVQYYYYFFS